MPDVRRRRCRRCRAHCDYVGPITWSGYCIECAKEVTDANVRQMMARSGPNWTAWRRGMAGCVGGALLDDLRDEA